MIVTSYAGHDEIRSAHRQAISQSKLRSLGMLRVFLLADIPAHEKYITQPAIADESNRFQDIVQGNFIEAYRNLTYKHTMGLRWVATECAHAKFVVKVDDDTVLNVYHIVNYLRELDEDFADQQLSDNHMDLLAGYILDKQKPIRVAPSKWFVSTAEFSGSVYPDYLSGWMYLTTPQTAARLVAEAQREPFFWIDDTWITGILRDKLDIRLTRLNTWFSANSEFLDCCIDDVKRFSYKCDYFAGPNGGEVHLITRFMHSMSKCYEEDDACFERTPDKLLSHTCVGHAKHLIEEHGDARVRQFKL